MSIVDQVSCSESAANTTRNLCNPSEVALKSFFLGPQAENGEWLADLIAEILHNWFRWRRQHFPEDGGAISQDDQQLPSFQTHQREIRKLALDLLQRYEAEVPKFSPRYIGHMFSEISLPALLGHVISLLHNPNIISSESALVGVQVENEAIEALLTMVGFSPDKGLGHFTSGGSVANYEAVLRARERAALWMARGLAHGDTNYFQAAHMGWSRYHELGSHLDETLWLWTRENPWLFFQRLQKVSDKPFRGPVLLVPHSKHYSWIKAAHLIGLGADDCWEIALDEEGKLSIPDLEVALTKAQDHNRPVLMVVSVAGTTELGEVDAIDKVQDVLDRYKRIHGQHIWHHVDGAYGAFFRTLQGCDPEGLEPAVWSAIQAMERTDSVTLDPHKLGYVPYSCGAFVARQREDYFVTCHDAPYIQYKSVFDRGKFTLEGSRSAGGATGTWLTAKSIGLHAEGYGRILARTIRIRRQLESALRASGLPIHLAPASDSNILCFHVAEHGEALSSSNRRTELIYEAFTEQKDFFVSKTILNQENYSAYMRKFRQSWQGIADESKLVLVRICLMNPFFGSREMQTDFQEEFIRSLTANIAVINS